MRAIFFGGPMNRQERVVNTIHSFRDVIVPPKMNVHDYQHLRPMTAQVVRYELLGCYDDLLLYTYGLTLLEVIKLMVGYFLGDNEP